MLGIVAVVAGMGKGSDQERGIAAGQQRLQGIRLQKMKRMAQEGWSCCWGCS